MTSTNHLYKGFNGPCQVISFTADDEEILALSRILLTHSFELDDFGKIELHIVDNLLQTLRVALKQIEEAK